MFTVGEELAPRWKEFSFNDSEVYQYDWVFFNVTWEDYFGINATVFSTNASNWTNSSANPEQNAQTVYTTNVSQIKNEPGYNFAAKFYANDSFGAWNQTINITFVVGGVIFNQTVLYLEI